jgi:protein-tyrosine phosphatase
MSTAFRILVVGVRNDFRSPLAERHLRHQLEQALGDASAGVVVRSAGVRAPWAEPMLDAAAAELARVGGTSLGFRSRALTRTMLRDADVILTVTRALRSRVLQDEPAALHRTFTFRELAALARLLPPPCSPHQFVVEAAAHRWAAGVAQCDLEPLAGASRRKQRQVADQVVVASRAIAGVWSRMLTPAG